MNEVQSSKFKVRSRPGFTLIELILVMGIFSTLIGITSLSLFNIQHKTALSANVNIFTADLKQQQLRAMAGEADGGSTSNYGLHFTATGYTLYRDYGTSNFVVNLSNNSQFSPIPADIIFTKGSGEVSNGATVTIKDTKDNSQKTITINKYGIVTAVN